MGASRWRVLRTVVLPLAIPPMLAGAMIVLIEALGEFGTPAVLGGEMYVLSTLMYFQIHGFFNIVGTGRTSRAANARIARDLAVRLA